MPEPGRRVGSAISVAQQQSNQGHADQDQNNSDNDASNLKNNKIDSS